MARTTVNIEVSITELDGTLMLWMAPPPSNILWLSFLEPPKLKLTAKPLTTNSFVNYTAMVRLLPVACCPPSIVRNVCKTPCA